MRLGAWLRALAGLNAQTVNGSEGATFPFWSPDSRFLAFFAGGKLKKVDLSGAPPQTLCDARGTGAGRGTATASSSLRRRKTDRCFVSRHPAACPFNSPRLDASHQETAHRHPYFLPDGQHFLFTVVSAKPEISGIYVGSLDSKERKRILGSMLKAAFVPPDHVLFVRHDAPRLAFSGRAAAPGGTLMAQPFDAKRFEIVGDPVPIAEVGGNFGTAPPDLPCLTVECSPIGVATRTG